MINTEAVVDVCNPCIMKKKAEHCVSWGTLLGADLVLGKSSPR